MVYCTHRTSYAYTIKWSHSSYLVQRRLQVTSARKTALNEVDFGPFYARDCYLEDQRFSAATSLNTTTIIIIMIENPTPRHLTFVFHKPAFAAKWFSTSPLSPRCGYDIQRSSLETGLLHKSTNRMLLPLATCETVPSPILTRSERFDVSQQPL